MPICKLCWPGHSPLIPSARLIIHHSFLYYHKLRISGGRINCMSRVDTSITYMHSYWHEDVIQGCQEKYDQWKGQYFNKINYSSLWLSNSTHYFLKNCYFLYFQSNSTVFWNIKPNQEAKFFGTPIISAISGWLMGEELRVLFPLTGCCLLVFGWVARSEYWIFSQCYSNHDMFGERARGREEREYEFHPNHLKAWKRLFIASKCSEVCFQGARDDSIAFSFHNFNCENNWML